MVISSEILMAEEEEDYRKNVREILRRKDEQIERARQARLSGSAFNRKLIEQQVNQGLEESGIQPTEKGEYSGSPKQMETYKKLEEFDKNFAEYVAENYGSYENYLKTKKIMDLNSVYDPNMHYIVDVRIKTADASYVTDHISPDEVIMEALSGVVTVVFMKVDASVRRLTGTLSGKIVPNNQKEVRKFSFRPMRGDRILMWDIHESAWKSFYMERVIRFIRDDTIGLE